MAKIKTNEQEMELPDGAEIRETCRELGVPFGCESGLCGTCEIEVVHGEENLAPLNEAEEIMCLEKGHRLACQCRILQGEIKIRY